MEIKTERLLLRPIEEKDAKEIFQYRSDSITNQYQGWIPESLDDVYTFINEISPKIDVADTWVQFVIINIESNNIIGDVGIHFLNADSEQTEIGCTLDKNCHGKGYATEALKATISYLIEKLNKNKIVCSVDPQNIKSIRLVERLGFRKEALLKESILMNGKWVDDLVYAIFKNKWKYLNDSI